MTDIRPLNSVEFFRSDHEHEDQIPSLYYNDILPTKYSCMLQYRRVQTDKHFSQQSKDNSRISINNLFSNQKAARTHPMYQGGVSGLVQRPVLMDVMLCLPSCLTLVYKSNFICHKNLLMNQQQSGKNSVFTAPQAIRIPKSRPILECKSNNIDRLPSTTTMKCQQLTSLACREWYCLLECRGQAQ